MNKDIKDNSITFKLDDNLYSKIVMLAAKQDASKSRLVTDALYYYFENCDRNPIDFICSFQSKLDLLKRKTILGETISESDLDGLYAEVNKTWRL